MRKNKNKKILPSLFCLAMIVEGFFVWANFARAAASDIVFTEIMYDPAGSDTKKEWVEIYNPSSSPITIVDGSGDASWRFNDGSNHVLTLLQGSLIIAASGVAIIASDGAQFLADHPGFSGTIIDTSMSLNNTTDTIKLSADKGESFFGQVTYQNSWGGSGDNKSLEKINSTGGNEQSNWQASTVDNGTPGAITTPSEQAQENNTITPPISASGVSSGPAPADPKKVKISEIFPSPDKDEKEFIELVNNNYDSIILEGWKLADDKKVIVLPTTTLVANEHRAFFSDETKITLNNDGDNIALYDKNGELIDKLSYNSTVKSQAFAYQQEQNKFVWTAKPTPNATNEITKLNDPPLAKIAIAKNPVAINEEVAISASESSDPDDDPLTFLWSIGKNWQAAGASFVYSFKDLGDHLINLKISDGQHESMATATISVLLAEQVITYRSNKITGNKTSTPIITTNTATATSIILDPIFINEIFPNPAGRDDNEWIELFNPNTVPVLLSDWLLDDGEGGSKPYKFTSQIIAANSYLIINKKESSLLLNNNNETVRLFNPFQQLVEQVTYKDAPENESYSRDEDDEWFWAEKTTPGKINANPIVNTKNNFISLPPAPEPFSYQSLPSEIVDIDLANIRELEIGSQVKVQGTVAVEPGVLAKTYFYITGSPGIQVYFSKRDWPRLALGDTIGVIGELTESNGETRLKIANKADIVLLYKNKPPEPIDTETGEIGEGLEGNLIKIKGELIKKQGNSWFVDDGSGETKITFQNGTKIKKPSVKLGDWVEVIGLVGETKSGYRILPRYQDDVKKIDVSAEVGSDGKVLGAATSTAADTIQRFRISANDKPRKILTYLLITSCALIILLAGLLIKLRIETKKRIKKLSERL